MPAYVIRRAPPERRGTATVAPRQATPRQVASVTKASSAAFYNPARIIDRSQLKIVDSIAGERQKDFAEERGDLVAPVNDSGATIVPKKYVLDAPESTPDTPGIAKLVIPAILAYFVFGG